MSDKKEAGARRELTDKRRMGIFLSILVTCIVGAMLSTALNTALPQMMVDFGVETSTGQWLSSIYSLVMGIMVLATPFLIRRVPTKRLFLFSIAMFGAGVALSALTSNFAVMMAGRVLQAASNGIVTALGQVVILTIFPLEKRGQMMGLYGLAIGVSPVVAPTIAGMIVDVYGWRMVFYIILGATVVMAVMAVVTFEDVMENAKEKFDLFSFALCALAFSGILTGIGNISTYSFFSLAVCVPLVPGIIAGVAFVFRQLKMETPFLELRVLQEKNYRTAVIASMLLYVSVQAGALLTPLYIQSLCGYSAAMSGLVTMPGSLVMALLSPFTGKWYDKMGMKVLFYMGSAGLVVSSLGMVFVGADTSMIWVAALNVMRNVSVGCMMMPLVTWGMSGLKEEHTSHGTALLTSLRTMAGAFGQTICVAVMTVAGASLGEMRGMNAAFLVLTLVGVAELLLAWFAFRKKGSDF